MKKCNPDVLTPEVLREAVGKLEGHHSVSFSEGKTILPNTLILQFQTLLYEKDAEIKRLTALLQKGQP